MNNCIINKYLIAFILLCAFIIGCENKTSPEVSQGLNYKYNLDTLSVSLATIDSNRIKAITTEDGYLSILEWSDTLKSKWFLKRLSNNLKDGGRGIFDITKHNDSIIVLSLGEEDVIIGATNGYLFLFKDAEMWKIDKYRGGK
jgi:hypothetical protein